MPNCFQKIMVIGCPGSGKSTFSRELATRTGLPLCHLDMMYHLPDKTTRPRDVFDAMLGEVLATPAWIIDGNYNRTLEMRMEVCDAVIFLDFDPSVCLQGVQERRGKPRSDMPWVEAGEDAEFLTFVKNFTQQSRPRIMALLEKYTHKQVYIFKTRQEAWDFLTQFN